MPANFSRTESHSEIGSAKMIYVDKQFFQLILAGCDMQANADYDKVAAFQC